MKFSLLYKLTVFVFFLLVANSSWSQEVEEKKSSMRESVDTVANKEIIKALDKKDKKERKLEKAKEQDSIRYNLLTPKRVSLYAALFPGLGQLKNKQYWKIPIVYVGLGVATYFVLDNQKEYNYYRSIYAGRMSNDPAAFNEMPDYSMETLRTARDYYRKNMELSIVFGVLGYGVQVIDAMVFAHLKDFDISDDLALRIQPSSLDNKGFGIGLALKF